MYPSWELLGLIATVLIGTALFREKHRLEIENRNLTRELETVKDQANKLSLELSLVRAELTEKKEHAYMISDYLEAINLILPDSFKNL